MTKVVITHSDADGLISLVIFLKARDNPRCRVFFSSNSALRDVICSSIIGNEKLEELHIFDISPSEKTLKLASVYERVLWIDHHQHQKIVAPENVELVVDSSCRSAAQLVAKYFGVEDSLVEIANQIDTNNIRSEEAEFLRDLIGAIKWKYRGSLVSNKLRSIAKVLVSKGLEEFEREESVARLISEFREWQKKMEGEALKRVLFFEVEGKRLAVYESTFMIPAYLLTERLREHKSAPFDIIAMLVHKAQKDNIITKIELRTHTGFDVHKIANSLGGGGHKVASGATYEGFLSAKEFVEHAKNFLKSS